MVLYGFLTVIKSSVVFPQLNVLLPTLLQLLVRYAEGGKLQRGKVGHPLGIDS